MKIVDKIFKEKLGVTKAIAFNSIARAIQGAGGFVTVFLVAKFLTAAEQGYYYTFTSILSIQIFIELGLGGIITQFVAHEFAFLEISEQSIMDGDGYHLSRLSSLVRFFIKWYVCAALLLLFALIIVGFSFFRNYSVDENIEWSSPWVLLVIATSLNLLLSPLFAFYEGINKVKEVAFIRMVTQFTGLIFVWCILISGGKLYTASFTALLNLVINIILLFKYHSLVKIVVYLLKIDVKEKVDYFNEIFPYQWKIALSWMSGYFIFQLFNPVLFATCGARVAGQMGMTLSVLNGILGLTLSWTSTNIPLWSSLIAKKKYKDLDISFNNVLKSSSLVCFMGITFFLVFLLFMEKGGMPLGNRFLPFSISAILSITIFINNIINAWATYLRCHKKEPFILQAVIVGFASALSTILSANLLGVQGVVIGYTLIVVFISMPLSYYIFKIKKPLYNV